MRAGFKITMKLGMIGAFLFCTPFFDGMRQLIEESSFLNLLVVRQEVSVSDFSLKHQLNVMSVPQEEGDTENVQESTIFTSEKPSAPAVNERTAGEKRVYIYDTHQSEEYLGGKTVLDGAKLLGEQLKEAGVEVFVETHSFADYMKENGLNYNDSYLVSYNFLNDCMYFFFCLCVCSVNGHLALSWISDADNVIHTHIKANGSGYHNQYHRT